MMRKLATVAALMAFMMPVAANAWSEVGHQAIAFVAEQHLRPRALDQVNKMLTRGIFEDALREFLFGPHPTMPGITLMGHQANDVIAYILSLKTPPARAR